VPLPVPTINGVTGGFESIRFRFGLFSFSEFLRELNYRDEMQPGQVKGTHPIKASTTMGDYNAEADFTCLERDWYRFLTSVPDGYTMLVTDVTVTKEFNPNSPTGFNTDILHRVRIIGLDNNYKRDDKDGRLVKVKLDLHYITRNGKCLAPQVLQEMGPTAPI
jgi:hypothetical protein